MRVPTPIPDFPGYGVTRDGYVWSRWKRGAGGLGEVWRRITGGTDKDGYKKVILCRDGVRFYFRVHVLVLTVFRGPCPAGCEGRHRNNRRDDNRVTNLSWSTHVDNVADKRKHGTHQRGERHGRSTITDDIARRIKQGLAAGNTPTVAARAAGVAPHFAMNIKKGAWAHVQI